MQKNVTGQKTSVFAYDSTTGLAKTGDAANITAYIWLDYAGGQASFDTNPAELDSVNAPGVYVFDLTQGETDADVVFLYAVSSTADIIIRPVEHNTAPPNFNLIGVTDDGTVKTSIVDNNDMFNVNNDEF